MNNELYEMIFGRCFLEEDGFATSMRCVFDSIVQFLSVHRDFMPLFDCYLIGDEEGNEHVEMKPRYLKKNMDFIKFLDKNKKLKILDTGLFLFGFRPIFCGKITPVFSKNVVGRRTVYGADGQLKIDEDIYGMTTWKR